MNDLRFAFRQLFKSPAFTLVAILTLALGIAASTAIFSVVDAVLLHPLPYPHSEQIVTVSQTVRSTGVSTEDASPANFLDWSAQNSVFSAMACARGWQAISPAANNRNASAPRWLRRSFSRSSTVKPHSRPHLRTWGRETGECPRRRAQPCALVASLWRRSRESLDAT